MLIVWVSDKNLSVVGQPKISSSTSSVSSSSTYSCLLRLLLLLSFSVVVIMGCRSLQHCYEYTKVWFEPWLLKEQFTQKCKHSQNSADIDSGDWVDFAGFVLCTEGQILSHDSDPTSDGCSHDTSQVCSWDKMKVEYEGRSMQERRK